MGWRRFSALLALVGALLAFGCSSRSKSSGVAITVSPSAASVITNGPTQSFTAFITGTSNTTANWTVACATGVTAGTCGSISPTSTTGSAAAVYTAPSTVPTTTSNGTTTAAPTVTITATSQADSNQHSSATVTVLTAISIIITPSAATVGTNEHFGFTATVTNPGCNLNINPKCDNVTWSITSTQTHVGTIDAGTGVYSADASTVPSPSSVIIQAKSVVDATATSTATVTVVSASTPTVTSVSPNTTALGGLFQDVDITGTNFISTDNVNVCPQSTPPPAASCVQLNSTNVTGVSGSLIRARIPDFILAAPPANKLQFYVSEQNGTGGPQTCTGTDQSGCQIALMSVRPGVVGPSPTSISQGTGGLTFNVDGGFFGTAANPAVTATFNGHLRGIQLPASGATNSTRQLSVAIGGISNPNDLSTPGLFPVAITSATDPTKIAVTNLAVQPTYSPPTATRVAVGSMAASAPSDVAIDPSTGIAVVANTGSNDVSLIDLASPTTVTNICTFAIGSVPTCPTSGPTSVAIDYNRNLALVANSASKTIAVVDLNARAVTSIIQLPNEVPPIGNAAGVPGVPEAVAINPVTGRGLVTMQSRSYGVLLDLTSQPSVAGVVSISTGANTKVAVEPHLNWALVTPGGPSSQGITNSLSIVDLNQQRTNNITAVSRTSNVVTVTIDSSASAPPLSVRVGDAVEIQNVQFPSGSANASQAGSFDGIYIITSIGPGPSQFSFSQTGASLADVGSEFSPQSTSGGTINYSPALFTEGLTTTVQGVGINPETQQAVLVDPARGGGVTFFSLIDLSSTTLSLCTVSSTCGSVSPTPDQAGPTAAAYNPLTNTVVAVNSFNKLAVIDPTKPKQLNAGNAFTTLQSPLAVAIDPATNTAVVVNQGDNSVSILNMGPIRGFAITETSPKTIVTASTLSNGPSPVGQTVTVVGKGLTCTGSSTTFVIRLDGAPQSTSCSGSGDRVLTANVLPATLSAAHRYALDVQDPAGNVTNAEDLTVEISVDVTAPNCSTPQPDGVAADPQLNVAAVSLFGCGSLALISLDTAKGLPVNVGSDPVGAAVIPRLHLAVAANNGSNNASIVDELSGTVTTTASTGSAPMGAAADSDSGEFAVVNNTANTVSIISASGGSGSHSVSTGQLPVAVAFNYANHEIGVAAAGSNLLEVSDASASSQSASIGVSVPTSVAYDPVAADCGQTATSTATPPGCFLVNSSTANDVFVFDPLTATTKSAFRVGINPTAIAYNFLTSTLVSTNTASRTMTIIDLPAQQIRAVLPLPPLANSNQLPSGVPQFAVDIHPFRNLAVIADASNGKVLFFPLPQ